MPAVNLMTFPLMRHIMGTEQGLEKLKAGKQGCVQQNLTQQRGG